MDINPDRLLAVIGRLRTPLALAGLVVVVVYLLFRQVLGSRVLAPLTSEGTLQVIDRIVTTLFLLALVAITFGFASFVLTPLLRRAATTRAARVQLVDASVDPHLEVAVDQPAREITELTFTRDALDFKFVNRGTATAVLHRFDVEVLDVVPDRQPRLSFAYLLADPAPCLRAAGGVRADAAGRRLQLLADNDAAGRRLQLLADNHGWGDATGCRVSLADSVLAEVFPAAVRTATADVPSGAERVEVLSVDLADGDQAALRGLLARRAGLLDTIVADPQQVDESSEDAHLLSPREWWSRHDLAATGDQAHRGRARERAVKRLRAAPTDRLPIGEPAVTVSFADGGSTEHRARHQIARSPHFAADLWLRADWFECDLSEVGACVLGSDRAYGVVLGPEAPQRRSYRISRVIDQGGADRFHVVLAAQESGDYTVRLTFHVNETVVRSRPLQVDLKRSRTAPGPLPLMDGESFKVGDGRLVLGGWHAGGFYL